MQIKAQSDARVCVWGLPPDIGNDRASTMGVGDLDDAGVPGWRVVRIAGATLTALVVFAGAARAQTAAPLVPIVTPLKADDIFASKSGLSTGATFAPLRLSLTGGLFSQANAFSGCDARTEASGNSVNGFAVQRYSFLRLTPQLTLHGFSMAGCSVDAGMGGGLTYTVPLRRNFFLIASAGSYAQPNFGGGKTFTTSAVRVDVVKQLAWGRTLSVGLGTRTGGGAFNALHFGGSF
jgi:hypothetical protein